MKNIIYTMFIGLAVLTMGLSAYANEESLCPSGFTLKHNLHGGRKLLCKSESGQVREAIVKNSLIVSNNACINMCEADYRSCLLNSTSRISARICRNDLFQCETFFCNIATASCQNPQNPLDVNNDTRVSPLDAQLIIAELGASRTQSCNSNFQPDVNGDGSITINDALRVINYLNAR